MKDKIQIVMECPKCNSNDVKYDDYPDIISNSRIEVYSSCCSCKCKWIETFSIIRIKILGG